MKLVFIFFLFIAPNISWCFPENVRHGYFNCTACHVSPSGGGVLTPYGRSLSAELMSTWGTAKTSGFFFSDNEDEKKNAPWWRANLFLRGVQTKRNTPTIEKAQFFPMQADFESGIDLDKYAVIATVGLRASKPALSKNLDQWFSRKHYALYRLSDNWTVRGGKFLFSYGLNGPDHVTATRRGLGWDQGSESYNFEATFSDESTSTILSVKSDAPSENLSIKDKGIAINQSFYISNSSRVGLSGFIGGQDLYDRSVLGPYWTWSITKEIYLDSEIFFQQKKLKSSAISQSGYATFHRLGYELTKGFIIFGQFDQSFLDSSDESTKYDSYGPGIQWLPFPHFEIMSYLGKEKAFGQDPTDYWWIMLNIYL